MSPAPTGEAELAFTGERLHEGDALFGVDLMRHRVAYHFAAELARDRGAQSILELGSGTGYGAAELAETLPRVVAVDRVAPVAASRTSGARFLRADLRALPFAAIGFDLVVSFQVIEHLEDPHEYLTALSRLLGDGGVALVTTPNRAQSDGENPFHVHEYEVDELAGRLGDYFEEVDLCGVDMRGEAARYHRERLARIRRIVRLDPLRLRRRIPRPLVEWLFGRAARLVRQGIAASDAGLPQVELSDFPIGPASPASLDLLAVCRRPRR